jgi:hypothetical protein
MSFSVRKLGALWCQNMRSQLNFSARSLVFIMLRILETVDNSIWNLNVRVIKCTVCPQLELGFVSFCLAHIQYLH